MDKYTTIEIESNSNHLLGLTLTEVFKSQKLKLRPYNLHELKEKGIDIRYEIENRERKSKTITFLNIQNKGTYDEVKVLKSTKNKGLISFQLEDIRQLHYFCYELHEAVIFFLCDMTNQNIYWHPIQLSSSKYLREIAKIEKEVDRKERKGYSVQIYIDPQKILLKEKKLVTNNLEDFFQDIERSEVNQHHLKQKRINKILEPGNRITTSLNKELGILNILDALCKIKDEFNGLNVIPAHVIIELFPFKTERYLGICDNDSIMTYNEELFNFFDGIKVKDGKYVDKEGKPIAYNKKKFSKAISFLKTNRIEHLYFQRSYQKRICLHNLFPYHNCDCIRCSIGKYAYSKSIESYTKRGRRKKELEYAYSLVELGLDKEAFFLYYSLSEKYRVSGDYIRYFIAKNNLKKIGKYLKGFVVKTDLVKVEKIIADTKFDDDLTMIKGQVTEEVFTSIQWIYNDSHINSSIFTIHTLVDEILEHYRSDQHGNWSRNADDETLKSEIVRLTIFIESNTLINNHYKEFRLAVEKATEGFLATHQIINNDSSRMKYLDEDIISIIITYCSTKSLRRILQRYHVKKINYKSKEHEKKWSFPEKIKNLSNSINAINEYLQSKSEERTIRYFKDTLRKLISNSMLILEKLEINNKEFNQILKFIINILIKGNFITDKEFSILNRVVYKCGGEISKQNLKKLIKFKRNNAKLHQKRKLSLHNLLFYSKDKNVTNEVISGLINSARKNERLIIPCLNYSFLLTGNHKRSLKSIIKKQLTKKFNSYLFYNAVLLDLVEYRDFEKLYLKSIPQRKREFLYSLKYTKEKAIYNERLNDFLNLAFKLNLNLNAKKYQEIKINNHYYNWLFNMRKFDYSKFNIYWVLEFNTKYYFEKMSKIQEIREALVNEMRINPSEGLLDIYLTFFV